MKNNVIAMAVAIVLSSGATRADYLSSRELSELCGKRDNTAAIASCVGYLMGVADALDTAFGDHICMPAKPNASEFFLAVPKFWKRILIVWTLIQCQMRLPHGVLHFPVND